MDSKTHTLSLSSQTRVKERGEAADISSATFGQDGGAAGGEVT